MHMADALVAPAVAATMYTASAVTAGVSVHKLRKDDSAQKLPTMAVMSALVFAGQMINSLVVVVLPAFIWGIPKIRKLKAEKKEIA